MTGERKRSILVLSATAGTGHVRAGEALAAAADSLDLPLTVRHEDILSFTSPIFRKLYAETYVSIVQRSPELWDFLYERTRFRRGKSPLLDLFDHFHYRKYLRALADINPDAVLCTHFLPYAAISRELARPDWKIPFFTVPTDYEVHALWIDPAIRRYYAASDEAAWTLRSNGVPDGAIAVTGIPVMPEFSARTGRQAAAAELGISPRHFTIMTLSGGFGVGVIDRMVPAVLDFLGTFTGRKFQLLVVCGKNEALRQFLGTITPPPNVKLLLFGFIPFVDRLMAASDLLITKSGALSTTEALARKLPMILFGSTPGQEAYNADYFVEHGAALKAHAVHTLIYKLRMILEDRLLLPRLRRQTGAIARPHAARDILTDLIRQLRNSV